MPGYYGMQREAAMLGQTNTANVDAKYGPSTWPKRFQAKNAQWRQGWEGKTPASLQTENDPELEREIAFHLEQEGLMDPSALLSTYRAGQPEPMIDDNDTAHIPFDKTHRDVQPALLLGLATLGGGAAPAGGGG